MGAAANSGPSPFTLTVGPAGTASTAGDPPDPEPEVREHTVVPAVLDAATGETRALTGEEEARAFFTRLGRVPAERDGSAVARRRNRTLREAAEWAAVLEGALDRGRDARREMAAELLRLRQAVLRQGGSIRD